MEAFSILFAKEMREQWRSLRLISIVGIFAGLGIMSPLLARYTPEIVGAMAGSRLAAAMPAPSAPDAVDQFLKNIGQFGALAAILVAMGMVDYDRERGTAAFVLTKPAARATYLAAKLAALATLLGAGVAVAGVGAWVYTALLFQPLSPAGFVAACGLIWLLLFTYASLTFLGSTVAPSVVVAAAVGFGGLVLGGIAAAIPGVGGNTPAALSGAARAFALGIPARDISGPLAASVAVSGVCLLLAWRIFERQEL